MIEPTKDYADTRRDLRPTVRQVCEHLGLPPPTPFSDEERIAVAMAEMGRERSKAGRKLASRQVRLEHDLARYRIDDALMPLLLEQASTVNPTREAMTREQARHASVTILGGATSLAAGAACGALEALLEALMILLSRTAVVVGPALATVVVSLLVQTIQFDGTLSWETVRTMGARALWCGFVVLLAAMVVYATIRALAARYETEGR